MSTHQAEEIVDLIVEQLYAWGVITERKYGEFNMNQREQLAERIKEKMDE